MPAEITHVTHRNPPIIGMSDREIAEETLLRLRMMGQMLEEWSPLLGQFRVSGLLAVRRAARKAANE
jgi:hypothetical protein